MDEVWEPIDEGPIQLLGSVLGERDSPEGSQAAARIEESQTAIPEQEFEL